MKYLEEVQRRINERLLEKQEHERAIRALYEEGDRQLETLRALFIECKDCEITVAGKRYKIGDWPVEKFIRPRTESYAAGVFLPEGDRTIEFSRMYWFKVDEEERQLIWEMRNYIYAMQFETIENDLINWVVDNACS